MRYSLYVFILLVLQGIHVAAQQPGISFSSSDTVLQTAFYRAKQMALHYKGKPGDAVGAWYESALPPRSAFCMRDVAHQAIAAEALGLHAANKNMLTLFARNITASKNWCSYWEINKYGKPAPEDYRNDTAFWYNLNANFDIMYTCWKLYLFTGDKAYISSPVFARFYEKSANDFIKQWVLQPDSLLTRPAHPNAPASFNSEDAFYRARGLPSYSEGVPNMKMGIDLVAALYRGLKTYAHILRINGKIPLANEAEQRAATYQEAIDKYWWNEQAQLYNTYYSNDQSFGMNEGETFLLWFDALKDSTRKALTMAHLLGNEWNVENMSYFPYILYKNGYWKEAVKYMLRLTNPATPRREYPEVSFGVILGFVNGLMGIEPDARFNRVTTVYRSDSADSTQIENLPLLGTLVNVTHTANKTEFKNAGSRAVIWRAAFYGSCKIITIAGTQKQPRFTHDEDGRLMAYQEVKVAPGKTVMAVFKE